MVNEFLYLIIGIVITFLIQNFVFPILPPSIRNFTIYHKKKLLKKIKRQDINIELIIKTKNYEGDISIDDITKQIKKAIQNQFNVSSTNTSLITKVPVGKNTVEIQITPMHYVDNEIMKFELLECHFTANCKFSGLNTCLMDFREAQRKIESILYEMGIRFENNLSLTCKLKSLHEITPILENTRFELMSTELSNGQQFEISRDKITIYDQEINDDTISLAEKMIVLYD